MEIPGDDVCDQSGRRERVGRRRMLLPFIETLRERERERESEGERVTVSFFHPRSSLHPHFDLVRRRSTNDEAFLPFFNI